MRSSPVTAASGLLIAIATAVAEISYVIEPFESIDDEWFDRLYDNGGHLNLTTTTDDALFGERALLVEYEVQQTETWGGFVDFGWIQNRTAHNCHGATHMSLWYKLKKPQSRTGRVHVRLIMLDDSDCLEGCADPPGQGLENYYSFHYVLDGDDDFDPEDPDTTGWKELRVELRGDDNGESPFWRTGWTGQKGNNVLDPDRLRGWRIELSMDSQAGVNATSAGVIVFDQLACVGGGDMLGAAFNYGQNHTAPFADAVSEGAWFERYYESPLSRNLSEALVEDGMLRLNYTIEQTEEWGGFLDYQHLVPGGAYYNLSNAFAVWLRYNVTRAASVSGRAHLRMILMDCSDCKGNCSEYPGQNLENYYSFNYILDDDVTDARSGYVTVALEGDSDSESPFWRPGWTGVLGNNVLDTSHIKGFRLELSINSQGEVGSLVSGAVSLSDLSAVLEIGHDVNSTTNKAPTCVNEPTLHFREVSSAFQRIEFLGGKCGATCEARDDCLYALSDGKDCFVASHLDLDNVGIQSTEHMQKTFNAFWMDDSSKRGDFCEKCECRYTDRTIDCRGRDLAIVPKTFSPEHNIMEIDAFLTKASVPWTPRVLDLRDNPRLVVLGSGALVSISDSLEELRLPLNMRHLSFESVNKKQLPALDVVRFEADDEHNDAALNKDGATSQVNAWTSKMENVISESSGFFGEVCCGRGAHVDLSIPVEGLRFCDMKVDTPGADAVYEEFFEYVDASPIKVLRPSSSFMAEAAESPKKCAEYCAISSECKYFSYDARWKESEHTCYLLENNGKASEKICCSPDDFANIEGTEPGWTSGRPPRTRNEVDKACVITGPRDLVVNKANGYEAQFVLSLGSTPLRGAVWIEPRLAESSTALDVSISPRRVALYDATMTATINVAVSNVEALSTGETLVVTNIIQSCDTAYTTHATPAATAATTVYIDVVVPSDSYDTTLLVAILVPSLVAVAIILIVACLYVERKKRQADSVWRVKPAELNFGDPPEIIGRGTFGLVLLAEYRGTQVAVKRVIPPKLENSHTMYFKTNLFGRGDSWRSIAPTAAKEAQTEPPTVDSQEFDLEKLEKGTKSFGIRTNFRGINSGFGINSSGMYKTFKSWRSSDRTRLRLKADFIVEMRHLSKLRHPCITTVMGAVIERREEPMLVMEYMDHGSLYDLLQNETMMLEGELLLPILRDIAQGVRFLHAASPQVVHSDLKAQNVLVDSKFRAKVADFGLSQKKQVGATGTPFWMAPELLRGDCENTAASDVYSFGIILYEVYSRRDPYEGENYEEVIKLVCDPIINKRPPVPSSCPPQVKPLMTDCLIGDPDKRPTFEELDQRLKQLDAETVEPGEMHFSMQSRKEKDVQRTNQLLFEVFPRHIAEGLRDGRKIEPESRDVVTIFFSDIVGFTNISSTLPPIKISDMLDRLYNSFDALSREHDVFKVETIGDAYMAVTNLVKDQPDHTKRIADFSVDAVRAANETLIDLEDPDRGCVNIRVGFHSGPVVANVVGSRNPRYCLFGDTVNTASRMESNSEQNRIHCSERAAKLLRRQHPEMRINSRGKIDVKGKGMMHTYWVNEEPSIWPGVEIREGAKAELVPMKKRRRSSMLGRSSWSRSSDGSINAAIFKAGILEGMEGNHRSRSSDGSINAALFKAGILEGMEGNHL